MSDCNISALKENAWAFNEQNMEVLVQIVHKFLSKFFLIRTGTQASLSHKPLFTIFLWQ